MLIENMSLFCVDLNREKKCEEDYISVLEEESVGGPKDKCVSMKSVREKAGG